MIESLSWLKNVKYITSIACVPRDGRWLLGRKYPKMNSAHLLEIFKILLVTSKVDGVSKRPCPYGPILAIPEKEGLVSCC